MNPRLKLVTKLVTIIVIIIVIKLHNLVICHLSAPWGAGGWEFSSPVTTTT